MTDIPSLCESVLRLDKEATILPWSRGIGGRIRSPRGTVFPEESLQTDNDEDITLVVEYRNIAPILATEVVRLRAELEDLRHFKAQVDGEGVVPANVMQELADTRAELEAERRKVEVANVSLKEARAELNEWFQTRNPHPSNIEVANQHIADALAALTATSERKPVDNTQGLA